ncbi:LamG domain-containing protein [Hyunsoonleella flava]|uniref:LamG domain-containing protein n=1 Tax=Hyunsoonleella flava TaxID=2527939 RepID=A0A4Q9FKS6_9FLAO|nr:LamG domain-containing protein [Hyunsoonleella flava]TBN05378.1 LamG domain-containing protein [Hyunsoonleella flava]
MKNISKRITTLLLLMLVFTACDKDNIDPITEVDPGPDAGAPLITIMKPTNGFEIQVPEPVTSIDIEFKAEDDIELDNIVVELNGVQIASYENEVNDTFLDYRIVTRDFNYDNIPTGDHVLTVKATDIAGNTATAMSSFSKKPPYTPLFSGEMFYMPFDGSFTNLISFDEATEVGSPGFAGEAKVGSNAYAGAADSYLTVPTAGMLGDEFSASFWYKVNATPDRAGILVIGPEDTGNANFPDSQNNRTSGFRLFRENAGGMQRIKLNVGRGDGDSWFDGGAAADIDPSANEWVHIAFTISQSEAVVYIDGQVVRQGAFSGVDWTGCDILSIMSGEPRFSGWNHRSDSSFMDELRLFNKALTQSEVTNLKAQGSKIFNMSFDGSYTESISKTDATEVGSPGFAGESKAGINAYAGAADSYLTFPTDGMLGDELSAAFWYKVNATPDRAGILVIGPEDTDNANFPDSQNDRSSGFRLFRENAGGMQRIKLNVGRGDGDSWFDGGAAADIDPASNEWVHIAFTVSQTEAAVYINGQVVRDGTYGGVDWTGCDILSIMSGAPRFTGWNHRSDSSFIDELQIFNKALSQTEIQAVMDN